MSRKFASNWQQDANARVPPEAQRQISPAAAAALAGPTPTQRNSAPVAGVTITGIDVPIVDLILLNFKLLVAAIPAAAAIVVTIWIVRYAMDH